MKYIGMIAVLCFGLISGTLFAQGGQSGSLQQLEDDLADEIVARQEADALLQSNIDAEAAARLSGDANLQIQLDDEEASRIAAIITEQNARVTADTSLQNNIDTEVSARQGADVLLQSSIDAETVARLSGDASLGSLLDIEQASRIFDVDNEEASRVAADASLQVSIDSLQSQIDALENGGNVLSGFAFIPNGTDTTTSTDVFVAGGDGFVLTDACAGVNNGGWAFSGSTVGDFIRVATDSECTTVKGISLPAGEVITCRPLFNAVSFGDTFCTVSGFE